jgi:small-conductance mechanosensitive channel
MTEKTKDLPPPQKTEAKPADKTPAASNNLDLSLLVERTTERIAFLKKQQEDLQQQRLQLEDLSRQRKELNSGRREVLNSLGHSISILDREEGDPQRKHSLVKATRSEFEKILEEVRAIREETWQTENIKEELSRALALISRAKRDYNKARGQIEALTPGEIGGREAKPLPGGPAPEILPASPAALLWKGLLFFIPAALLALLVAFLIRLIQLK